MKLAKSILLGSTSALLAVAGAQAADLPARKAAPVEYVKVCDAYGAGFFYIPGTDTCLKVGGRVRADFAMSRTGNIYSSGTIVGNTGVITNNVSVASGSENRYGWETRGRVDLDARTQTPYGTVQAVASIRLTRTSGVLSGNTPTTFSTATGQTLEAAYIRFAGFTFGAARDNFAFMPSTFYGSGNHWASFANGAKQIAYTAVLGGGFSATIAMQDMNDTSNGGRGIGVGTTFVAGAIVDPVTGALLTGGTANSNFAFRTMPQFNGRLDWDQGWGSMSVMGAVGRANTATNTGLVTSNILGANGNGNADKAIYAVGAGLKINLPMIAAGDVLWLNGAYAKGMTEYTINNLYFKSSDTRLSTTGFVQSDAPSWINTIDPVTGNASIETLKSWNLAALFTHFWTPEWRHSFLASGGRVEGSSVSRVAAFNAGGFGNATVFNVGTQLAWLPTRNFEIGVDLLYNRVSQDVGRTVTGTTGTFGTVGRTSSTRETTNGVSGRLRVERTF